MRPKTVDGVTKAVFNDADHKALDKAIDLLVQFRMCHMPPGEAGLAVAAAENTLRELQKYALKIKAAVEKTEGTPPKPQAEQG